MLHHPFIMAYIAWWGLVGLTVHLDAGAFLIGLLPTGTVIVQYLLARRLARKIASDAAEKVAQVHTLVNSQHEDLKDEIAEVRADNHALYDRLAALPPPPSGAAQ